MFNIALKIPVKQPLKMIIFFGVDILLQVKFGFRRLIYELKSIIVARIIFFFRPPTSPRYRRHSQNLTLYHHLVPQGCHLKLMNKLI
jgi:hypothetical protein